MCSEKLNFGKEIAIFDLSQSKRVPSKLSPLRQGKPVALKLREVSVPLPKRYPFPILLIVPSESVGLEGGIFLSIPGLRSEYMPRDALTTGGLVRMGLTRRASTVLIDELKTVYEVNSNGH